MILQNYSPHTHTLNLIIGLLQASPLTRRFKSRGIYKYKPKLKKEIEIHRESDHNDCEGSRELHEGWRRMSPIWYEYRDLLQMEK